MTEPRILIAGIGNIFLGDDAFGVEVAQRLTGTKLPEGVRVVDFGIRGFDLAYALLDNYDAAILVDAVPRGGLPGTLYVLESTLDETTDAAGAGSLLEAHSMDPGKVLRAVVAMGGKLGRVLIVGCEPATPADAVDVEAGLSEAVRSAVDEAVRLI